MSKYFLALLLVCLSGCGLKASLELPPGPPPEPLLGKSKPAPKPAPAAPAETAPNDLSTDKNRSTQ